MGLRSAGVAGKGGTGAARAAGGWTRPRWRARSWRAVTVAVKVLVEATPISGPAWVYTTPWASRARALPTTFEMATTGAPLARAVRTAPRVSAVSPDWLMATTSVSGPTTGSR